MDHPQMAGVSLDFVECRNDGALIPCDASNVKLRQWTKASPRMASQVRDSMHACWRNAELGLRVQFTDEALAVHRTLFICVYRHWSPCVDRRSAQQRVLVRVDSNGTLDIHESISRCAKAVASAHDPASRCTTLLIPLVPFSFKLPTSSTLLDEWKGQARNVNVFFTVRTPSAYLRVLPSSKDSLAVEQYPKRVAPKNSSSASSSSSPEPIDFPQILPLQPSSVALASSAAAAMVVSSDFRASAATYSSPYHQDQQEEVSGDAPAGSSTAATKRAGTDIGMALKGSSSENLMPVAKARRVSGTAAHDAMGHHFAAPSHGYASSAGTAAAPTSAIEAYGGSVSSGFGFPFAIKHDDFFLYQGSAAQAFGSPASSSMTSFPMAAAPIHPPSSSSSSSSSSAQASAPVLNSSASSSSTTTAASSSSSVFPTPGPISGPAGMLAPGEQQQQQYPGVINFDHMHHLILSMHGVPTSMLVGGMHGVPPPQ